MTNLKSVTLYIQLYSSYMMVAKKTINQSKNKTTQ